MKLNPRVRKGDNVGCKRHNEGHKVAYVHIQFHYSVTPGSIGGLVFATQCLAFLQIILSFLRKRESVSLVLEVQDPRLRKGDKEWVSVFRTKAGRPTYFTKFSINFLFLP
jgi:hypothetical protein